MPSKQNESKTTSGKQIAIIGGCLGIVVSGIAIFTFLTGIPSLNLLKSNNEEQPSSNNNASPVEVYPTNESQVNVQPNPPSVTDPYPALLLPFEDNFDTGLNANWRVVSGNPLIINGRLSAADKKDIYIEIGNNQLKDYTVNFQVFGKDVWDWGGYFSDLEITFNPTLKVNIDTTDGGIIRAFWYGFDGNEWAQLQDSSYQGIDNEDAIQIIASGNSYSLYVNGQVFSSVVYGSQGSMGSPLKIHLYGDNILLDNFSIRE